MTGKRALLAMLCCSTGRKEDCLERKTEMRIIFEATLFEANHLSIELYSSIYY